MGCEREGPARPISAQAGIKKAKGEESECISKIT